MPHNAPPKTHANTIKLIVMELMITRPRLLGLGVCGGIAVFHYGISSRLTLLTGIFF
jgi:hypothetical protein